MKIFKIVSNLLKFEINIFKFKFKKMNIQREGSLNIAKKPIFQYNFNENKKNTVLLLKDKTVSIHNDS